MLIFKPYIFRLFSATTLALLFGCASAPEKPVTSDSLSLLANPPVPKQKIKPTDVNTSIDPDVLFMLLTAELAGQRGQYDIALEGYMEAAKRVQDPRFAERAAMIALYLKDGRRLNDSVNIWLRQDPKNITALKFAALSAFKAGDKTTASLHVDALLKNDPAGFDKSLLEIATVLQKDNKADLLIGVLDDVATKHPDQAIVYFVEALLASQMDKQELAATKVAQALLIRPEWDKALLLQAQLAILSGNYNKAEAVLKSAVAKFPEDNKLKKLLAQVLIKIKDYDEAIQVYQAIIKANPKESDSRLALGLIYIQQDKLDDAEDMFITLAKQPETQSQGSYYLGKIAEQQDDLETALKWYDKVNDEHLMFDAGIAAIGLLGKDKQYAEAENRLAALAKKFPKQKLRVLLTESELLNQQQQYQKAFNLLATALADAPDQKELLYAHALMAEHIGKLDVLEANLKKIIAQHPDNAEALNALGYTLADKTNRYQEAETYLLKALKIAPDEAVILDSYGWLQFKMGNLAKSLEYLDRAFAKQQENEIAAHLAEVLWFANQKDKALRIFKKAFKESPEDRYLLEFKKRIMDKAE